MPCHYNDWGRFLPLKMGPGGHAGISSLCLIQPSSPGMFMALLGDGGMGGGSKSLRPVHLTA